MHRQRVGKKSTALREHCREVFTGGVTPHHTKPAKHSLPLKAENPLLDLVPLPILCSRLFRSVVSVLRSSFLVILAFLFSFLFFVPSFFLFFLFFLFLPVLPDPFCSSCSYCSSCSSCSSSLLVIPAFLFSFLFFLFFVPPFSSF